MSKGIESLRPLPGSLSEGWPLQFVYNPHATAPDDPKSTVTDRNKQTAGSVLIFVFFPIGN